VALRAELARLTAVRERLGAPSAPRRRSEEALAARLGGALVADGLVALEHHTPLPARHGRWSLDDRLPEHLAGLGAPSSGPLLLDTETTGLAGGTGTTAFLVGATRLLGGALVTRQYLLTRFSGEPALLEAIAAFADGTDTLVTFNGKSFDLPLLATRYRLCGLANPFAGHAHLDLLHPLRRSFGRGWPDCRLGSAETRLLGFERTDDLPSAEVPEVWQRWLRGGDAGGLPAVVAHNRWDLLSLAALLPALAAAFASPHEHGADLLAVARQRGERLGPGAAHALLAAHRERLDARGLLALATLARRHGEAARAVAIWRDLAADGHAEALERLAKHAEHVERDPLRALELTRRLIALEPWCDDHRRRSERLARKAGPGGPLHQR
jgi:hypothetical protein